MKEDRLHELIQTLLPHEKRYFKQFSLKGRKIQDGHFQQLFDKMGSMEVYDELHLKKKIKSSTLRNNLPTMKYQLQNLLMKSLQNQYSEQTERSKICNMICQIELLVDRRLYQSGLKLTMQAKKMAIKYEHLYLLLEILDWERLMILSTKREDVTEALQSIIVMREDTIKKIENICRYRMLDDTVYAYYVEIGTVKNKKEREKMEQLMSAKELQDINYALTVRSKLSFYQCHQVYAFMIQNANDQLEIAKKYVEVFEDNPAIVEKELQSYIGRLTYLSYAYMLNGEESKMKDVINKLRQLIKTKKRAQTELSKRIIISNSYKVELDYFNTNGKFYDGKLTLDAIGSELESIFSCAINKDIETDLYHAVIYIYFGSNHFDKALIYINRVLNNKDFKIRKDLMTDLMVIRLIIFYEQGNHIQLSQVVLQTYRFLLKTDSLNPIQKILLSNFRKLVESIDKERLLQQFKTVKEEIEAAQKQHKFTFGFDYLSWLNSKINHTDFEEEVRKSIVSATNES